MACMQRAWIFWGEGRGGGGEGEGGGRPNESINSINQSINRSNSQFHQSNTCSSTHRVEVVGPVGGAEDHDGHRGVRQHAVPQGHELGLQRDPGRLVVPAALAEEGVDLVDEDDGRRELLETRGTRAGWVGRGSVGGACMGWCRVRPPGDAQCGIETKTNLTL